MYSSLACSLCKNSLFILCLHGALNADCHLVKTSAGKCVDMMQIYEYISSKHFYCSTETHRLSHTLYCIHIYSACTHSKLADWCRYKLFLFQRFGGKKSKCQNTLNERAGVKENGLYGSNSVRKQAVGGREELRRRADAAKSTCSHPSSILLSSAPPFFSSSSYPPLHSAQTAAGS